MSNLSTKELVHPDIYAKEGEEARGHIDPKLLKVAEFLGKKFGRIVVNNKHIGGSYKDSGLRYNFGSLGSAHRFGMALDLKFLDSELEEVYSFIQDNQEQLYELGLRRVEKLEVTPGWLHIDTKPDPMGAGKGKIDFFLP